MARIKPFKAIYPRENYQEVFPVQAVKSSVFNSNKKITIDDNSYLKIILPTLKKSRTSKKTLFQQVRTNYETFKESDVLKESSSSIFVYEQLRDGIVLCRGIITLTHIDDFTKKVIKKHEEIVEQRKKVFTKYLETVEIQTEPVLISYSENSKLEILIDHEVKSKALLNFFDKNQIRHKVWQVDNALKVSQFKDALSKNQSLYLVDGHHRVEATEKNAKLKRKLDKDRTGNEGYNFVLSYLVPSTALKINEYIRFVKHLNGLSKEEFISKVSENFNVTKKGDTPYYPSQKFHISMYIDGDFYSLYIKKEDRSIPEGLGELDTYLLESLLLKPLLSIDSSNTDNLFYYKGDGNISSSLKMKAKVDSGKFIVGFVALPIVFNDLKLISDLGLTMPPKSTYINPKLLTGMLMYDMK